MLDGDYAGHLKLKQKLVEGYLRGICKVMPITGMQDPYHYRNRCMQSMRIPNRVLFPVCIRKEHTG